MDSSTATPATPEKQVPLFINRNFALLWSGQSISNVGDFVFDTTLILWIGTIIAGGQTWAPLAVSGVLVATAVPIFLIGPIVGVFVDRWNKRRTMLAMDASRAILIALLLLVALGTLPIFWQLGAIYAVVFLASACAQFFNPARFTLIGDIVEEPYRARASGLGQTTMNLAKIIGPPIAAPLLFTIGVQWALIVNSLSFVVSFLAILAVHVPPSSQNAEATQHESFFQEFSAGIRFFASNHVLVTVLISIILVVLGLGCIDALGVFFVTQNLHVSADLFGFMAAAVGAGAVVGAILASMFAQRLGEARTFWLGLIATGIVILLLARMTSFPLGVACFALAGLVIAPVNVAVGPLVLHATPREFVGRVIAVIDPLQALTSILSISLAGTLASTLLSGFHTTILNIAFGPIDTIFTGTGILTILGGLYAMRSLRGVTLGKAAASAPEAVPAAEAQAAADP
jgi:MFS family permease